MSDDRHPTDAELALEDPAGQGVDAVRPIRDEIDRRIRGLIAELLPTAPAEA
jgi:arsenate reductase